MTMNLDMLNGALALVMTAVIWWLAWKKFKTQAVSIPLWYVIFVVGMVVFETAVPFQRGYFSKAGGVILLLATATLAVFSVRRVQWKPKIADLENALKIAIKAETAKIRKEADLFTVVVKLPGQAETTLVFLEKELIDSNLSIATFVDVKLKLLSSSI